MAALKADNTIGISFTCGTHLTVPGFRVAIQRRTIELHAHIGHWLTIIEVVYPHQAAGREPLRKQTQISLQHQAIKLTLGPLPFVIKVGVLIQLRLHTIGCHTRTRQGHLGGEGFIPFRFQGCQRPTFRLGQQIARLVIGVGTLTEDQIAGFEGATGKAVACGQIQAIDIEADI